MLIISIFINLCSSQPDTCNGFVWRPQGEFFFTRTAVDPMHGHRKRDSKTSCRKVGTSPIYVFFVTDRTCLIILVYRSNASIEVWDVSYKPHIDRVLICDSSVEGLAWYNERLFSCSANGTVTEHDLHSLSPLVCDSNAIHQWFIVLSFFFIYHVCVSV